MKKVLFLIDTLGGGGAEKVLTVLTGALSEKYDITVQTLFDEGVYRDALKPNIRYKPGFAWCGKNFRRVMQRVMKYLPAKALHRLFVKENYDCEIAFLEGATTKVISGGDSARKLAWVHTDLVAFPDSIRAFYPKKKHLIEAYLSLDGVACVSKEAKESLEKVVPGIKTARVLYNPVDKEEILKKADECGEEEFEKKKFTFSSVGRMVEQKGFDRLLNAAKKLKDEGFDFEILLFGVGRLEKELISQAQENSLTDTVRFMGFCPQAPYYVKKSDAYVCSSRAEGYSLTVAEALILGVPVISTRCTGPVEILNDGEYGILTENSTQGIYKAMKQAMEDKDLLSRMKEKALERSCFFDLSSTCEKAVDLIEG